MNTEQLMQPRYKVIADYPKSIHRVGDIYTCGGKSEDLLYADHSGPRMRDYPHLFRKLEWWEERKPEDMPAYLKFIDDNGNLDFVLKVEKFITHKQSEEWWAFEYLWESEPDKKRMAITGWLPANETEYDNYKNNLK